ncbi:MAG: type I-B CRISPR-associated protein Cas5 [Nitrospirae bacterium]|nr:type I-B CRISPR-associated protein Cas5 [Nitrospirota bacterium]
MQFYRIHLKGWTASFRYPVFVSGFQPTLPVPPLSTVFGLISAACGSMTTPENLRVGYVFRSAGNAVDLETIYELSAPLTAKSNVCRREFLFEPELFLYLDRQEYARSFQKPCYPLLMGRSSELATVVDIRVVDLEERKGVSLGGTVVPFPTQGVHGPLQALPTHFTDGIPRRAAGTRPFYLLKDFLEYSAALPFDEEMDWGVWVYGT